MAGENRKRREAAIRILQGGDYATEAKRLGVSIRTLERAVAKMKKDQPEVVDMADPVGQPAVSVPVVPSEKGPSPTGSEAPSPALQEALKAAGEAPAAGPKPVTPQDLTSAAVDKAQFCVDTLSGIRMAAGVQLVEWAYNPPLTSTDPEVLKILKLDPFTEVTIRAHADTLYPQLVALASSKMVLYVALGMSGLGLMFGLGRLAKQRGWEPPQKNPGGGFTLVPGGRPVKAKVPSEADYAASLRPQPKQEDPASTPAPAAPGVVDAPKAVDEA